MANKKKSNTKKKTLNKTEVKKVVNTQKNRTQINKSNNKKVINKTSNTKKKVTTTLPKKKTKIKEPKIIKPRKIKKTKLTKKIILEEEKKDKKLNITLLVVLAFIIIISLIDFCYFHYYLAPTPIIVDDIRLDNDTLIISFHTNNHSLRNDIYCLYKEDKGLPDINDSRWFKTTGSKCSYRINDKSYYTFLKNEDDQIFKVNKTEKIMYFSSFGFDKNTIYMPKSDTYKLNLIYDENKNIKDKIKWSSDNSNVATVNDGVIKSIEEGETNITASIYNKKVSAKVIVTSLITKRPSKGYDYKKKYLSCNKYSKEENDLLDEILKTRINDAGYKTRAGVVEAARFLTLDFPYKINYFYENGRQTTNKVDGEGRYYHEGLYLHKSRYNNITGSKKGPKTWGCNLYSTPAHRKIKNGLDCSGFVSWALLNGGFNPKDVGAGWSDNRDLTDYGKVKKITTTLAKGNTIKVGDLLHSERAGGHIGIIVGIDKNNYYVAQALWSGKIGVVITKIKKSNLKKHFPHVVLMDKYYKKDGNLTNMW